MTVIERLPTVGAVTVKYDPDFKPLYQRLPDATRVAFDLADRKAREGKLGEFEREGWMYFVHLDDQHAAFGSFREAEEEFYWIFVGSKGDLPVIL